jgi:hypothetical protein
MRTEMSTLTASEATTHLMLACGGVVDPDADRLVDYYGSAVNVSYAATEAFLNRIIEHGLNYDACGGINDSKAGVFSGTSVDYDDHVEVCEATLVAGDGTEARWAFINEVGFAALINKMAAASTLDAACDLLLTRLTSPHNSPATFPYSCHL